MSPAPVPLPRTAVKARLVRALLAWYDVSRRDLPWRFSQHGADPYRVWLAEVMLQQTQVAAAIPYFRRFVDRYPTVEALAAARDEDVFALWSGLGYYARCRNLLAAARAIAANGGRFPTTVEGLRALPGFGPYTAGAVASIAFAIRAPIVDGNVARVFSRVFLIEGDPAAKDVQAAHWGLAAALVPDDRPGDFNQALMELGATICTRANPGCARCPVARDCGARAAGREKELPTPRARPARKALTLACAVIRRADGAVLLERSEGKGLFRGLWSLPCAEVAQGEAPSTALAVGQASRLGRLRVADELARVQRTLTHRDLTLIALEVVPARLPREGSDRRYVALDPDAPPVGLSTAMRTLLRALAPPPLFRKRSPRAARSELRP